MHTIHTMNIWKMRKKGKMLEIPVISFMILGLLHTMNSLFWAFNTMIFSENHAPAGPAPIFKSYIQKETNTILHRINSKPDKNSLFPTPTITFYNKAWNSFGPNKASTRCKQTFDCNAFLDSTNETLLSKSDIVVFSPWMDQQHMGLFGVLRL